jgi:hypothetical protein
MNENIILNEAGIQKFPSSVAVVDVEVGKRYWRFKQRNSSSTGTPNTGGWGWSRHIKDHVQRLVVLVSLFLPFNTIDNVYYH